jgi:hypothetical protein
LDQINAQMLFPIPATEPSRHGKKLLLRLLVLHIFGESRAEGDIDEVFPKPLDLIHQFPSSEGCFVPEIDQFVLSQNHSGSRCQEFRDEQSRCYRGKDDEKGNLSADSEVGEFHERAVIG